MKIKDVTKENAKATLKLKNLEVGELFKFNSGKYADDDFFFTAACGHFGWYDSDGMVWIVDADDVEKYDLLNQFVTKYRQVGELEVEVDE